MRNKFRQFLSIDNLRKSQVLAFGVLVAALMLFLGTGITAGGDGDFLHQPASRGS